MPVQPDVAADDRPDERRTVRPGRGEVNVKETYAVLGSRVGHSGKSVEVTSAAAGGGLVVHARRRAVLSGMWFRRLP